MYVQIISRFTWVLCSICVTLQHTCVICCTIHAVVYVILCYDLSDFVGFPRYVPRRSPFVASHLDRLSSICTRSLPLMREAIFFLYEWEKGILYYLLVYNLYLRYVFCVIPTSAVNWFYKVIFVCFWDTFYHAHIYSLVYVYACVCVCVCVVYICVRMIVASLRYLITSTCMVILWHVYHVWHLCVKGYIYLLCMLMCYVLSDFGASIRCAPS